MFQYVVVRWFHNFKIPFSLLFHILFSLGFFYQDLGYLCCKHQKLGNGQMLQKRKMKSEATNMVKADIINLLGWRCQKCFFRVTCVEQKTAQNVIMPSWKKLSTLKVTRRNIHRTCEPVIVHPRGSCPRFLFLFHFSLFWKFTVLSFYTRFLGSH